MKNKILLFTISGANLASLVAMQLLAIKILGAGFSTDQVFIGLSFGMTVLSILATTLGVFLIEIFNGIADKYTLSSIRFCNWYVTKYFLYSIPIMLMIYSVYYFFNIRNIDGVEWSEALLVWLAAIIQFFVVPFISRTSIINSFLYSRGRFIFVEATALLSAIISIVLLCFCIIYPNVLLVSMALLARTIVNYLLCDFFVNKLILRNCKQVCYIPRKILQDLKFKSRGFIYSSIYYKSDLVIDRVILSFFDSGLVSIYHIVQSFGNGVLTLYSKIVSIPYSKKICDLKFNNKDIGLVYNAYLKINFYLIFLSCCVSTVLYVYAERFGSIVSMFVHSLEGRPIIIILSCIIPIYALLMNNQILSNTLFSIGKGELTVNVGVTAYTVAIILKAVGVLNLSYYGLFAAMLIHQIIVTLMFMKKIKIELMRCL